MNKKSLASLALLLSSTTSAFANGTPVAYPAAYTVGVGAVSAGASVFVWAPVLGLTFGFLALLLVLVARQPKDEMKKAPEAAVAETPTEAEEQYEFKKAA